MKTMAFNVSIIPENIDHVFKIKERTNSGNDNEEKNNQLKWVNCRAPDVNFINFLGYQQLLLY